MPYKAIYLGISAVFIVYSSYTSDYIELCALIVFSMYVFVLTKTSHFHIKNVPMVYFFATTLIVSAYNLFLVFPDLVRYKFMILDNVSMKNNVVYCYQCLCFISLGNVLAITSGKRVSWNFSVFRSRGLDRFRNVYVVLALIGLGVMYITFIFFARGYSYVELHSSLPSYVKLLFKARYVVVACVFLLLLQYNGLTVFQKRSLHLIIIAYGIFFLFFMHMRMPVLFICLMYAYFRLKEEMFTLRYMAAFGCVAFIMFLVEHIRLDEGMALSGIKTPVLITFVNIGVFMNTLEYARETLLINGAMPGVTILNVFRDFNFASDYASQIAYDYFRNGGGFGFFYLSELMINFGVYGGWFFLLAFAFILTRTGYSKNKYVLLLNILLLCSFFSFVRNDVSSALIGFGSSYIVIVLLMKLARVVR